MKQREFLLKDVILRYSELAYLKNNNNNKTNKPHTELNEL